MELDKFPVPIDGTKFGLSIHDRDKFHHNLITGEIFWTLVDQSGQIMSTGHFKNIVTLDASILIARLMKGAGSSAPHQSETNFGIFALAVGTGDIAWDPNHPPPPTNTQRSLFNELARKSIQSTSFIDSDGNISGVPTNVVDFTTTFGTGEAVGPLTEMGLLGGDIDPNMAITNPILPPNGVRDQTVSLVGRDTLINYTTFGAINKPNTASISWTWRLTF